MQEHRHADADGKPVDRNDNRLFEGGEGIHEAEYGRIRLDEARVGEILEVIAGRKRSAGTRDQYSPYGLVVGGPSDTTVRQRVAVGVAAVLALTLIVAPLFTFRDYLLHTRVGAGNVQTPFPVERNGRRFYLGDFGPYLASRDVIADLATMSKPGERLLVGPSDLRRTWYSDAFFYYMFPELTPATYFIEMDPGLANAPGSRLASEVASSDWVILTSFWDGWREPNSSMDFGSDEPNQVLHDKFCEVKSYQDGLVRLFHRCAS